MAVCLFGLSGQAMGGGLCLSPPGDITDDGKTNVTDAQCIVLMSLWSAGGSAGAPPGCLGHPVSYADITCDGAITVGDAQALVALIVDGALPGTIDGDTNQCADACEGFELGRPSSPPVVFSGSAAGGGLTVQTLTPWGSMPTTTGGISTGNSIRSEVIPTPAP
jgi:hypothetical protein